jgi:hypothetical protein
MGVLNEAEEREVIELCIHRVLKVLSYKLNAYLDIEYSYLMHYLQFLTH